MANFDAQITDLVGGTIDQTACDQWGADACKEIIHQLPQNLKAKCSTVSTLNGSSPTMDLDGKGEILFVTREDANVGSDIPCRAIPSMHGGSAIDSDDMMYFGTATDPVYWIASNTSSVGTLFVAPAPTSLQLSYVHHIAYPTVNVSDVSTIANFPDEAEHLVVLYIAIRQLLQYQSTMSSDFNNNIGTALTAIKTALDRIASYNWGDSDTFDAAAAQLTRVKNALNNAENLINGNQPSATTDAYGALANEDVEIMSAALQTASAELSRASAHLTEWSTISGVAVGEAQGFIAEATTRLQQDVTKYQWYGDQYAKLSAEYARGLAALKGGAS